ncbi:1-phosphofructokinase [Lactobacillus sp. AN1001]
MVKIYTCTMNMAIDLFIETPELLPNTVNRTSDDEIQANGKGINVSLILKQLGIDNTALGFCGGFTGRYIADFLSQKQIPTDFIEVDGMTRINVFAKVQATKDEYKLVNQGPKIMPEEMKVLLDKISQLKAGDYLCVSGSLPRGVPEDILVEISKICEAKQINLILDTSAKTIHKCLPYHPFLLKPNEQELSSWFGKENLTIAECLTCCKQLVAKGAKQVLLSLGENGGAFVNGDGYILGNSPKGVVVNTACAGDTMLATFLAEQLNQKTEAQALKLSLAAGSSTAFRRGLTDFSDVDQLLEQIELHEEVFKND